MTFDVRRLAADVLRARELSPPKIFVDQLAETSLENAYALQHELTKLRRERGDTQIGYKVGCTSKQTQAQLGIHTPVFGRLFTQDQLTSPQTIHRNDFDGLGVEGELAVLLDRDPRELPTSQEQIALCTTEIFPVIELHHMGLPNTTLNTPILVGNNAIHAGFVHTLNEERRYTTSSQNLAIRLGTIYIASHTEFHGVRVVADFLPTARQT